MPKHAAAALESAEEWNEHPSAEEIEHRRRLLAEIRALRSHPATEEEKEFWREFDEEVRGPQPPLNAPVTEEEMEHRKRVIARIQARMAKPATKADERLWQEFMADLERERPTFRS
ncbi:MAG: hypothetical protein QOF89_6131 [Acidobacteriota bacterium]|jgi:hypothetical protein|nr:hypothetical protein [Acidobacteriota bacterium]